ncbi:MAG: hypothetical protein V4755_06245 [Curtobacterium sp.]
MTRAETSAVVALLHTDPALVVHVMRAPDQAATPYVLVRPGVTTDSQERLTGDHAVRWPEWSVMAVGADHDECAWAVERIDAALRPRGRGAIPTVTGRRCGPIRRDVLHEMDIDDDTSPPLTYQPAEYSFRSAPLPSPA